MDSQFGDVDAVAERIQAEARGNAPKSPLADIQTDLDYADDLERRKKANAELLAKLRAQAATGDIT